MKKKHAVLLLLAVGLGLTVFSVVLANMAIGNVSIIGGAGWYTFRFVFETWKGGLCRKLAWLGIAFLLAAPVVGLVKKKRK